MTETREKAVSTPADRDFWRSVIIAALVLTVLASALLILAERAGWLWGLWAGTLWLGLNSLLIQRLLALAMAGKEYESRKVIALCLVKFPVLYLAGFFLIIHPAVRLEGLVTSFSIYLPVVGLVWMRARFTKAG